MQKKSIAISICLLAQSAIADTFILKDGSKIVGNILSQDSTSYVIEVQFTKSIKEEKTIAKADIEKIQSERLDLTAFEGIEKLFPTPDALSGNDYDARIKKVEKFLTDHSKSEKSKQAQEILTALKNEANAILAGGVKLNGKIIPSEEYRNNLYEIDARIQEEKIRALVKSSQNLAALRAFDSFTLDFRNTQSYSALLPLITQVITSYQREINGLIESFETRTKTRLAGLERMTNSDRVNTEKAIQEEAQQCEALLAREKKSNIGWVTIHPFFVTSLEDTSDHAQQILSQLASSNSSEQVDGGKLFRDALSLINAQADADAVNTAISDVTTAEIPQRYITILEDMAKAIGIKND